MKVALYGLQNMAASYSAVLRVNKLLLADEDDEDDKDQTNQELYAKLQTGEISIRGGTFSWESQKAMEHFKGPQVSPKTGDIRPPGQDENLIPEILLDINLDICQGELIAIVGSVGSGKSSLLNCCIQEMYKNSGDVAIKGSLAYMAQDAFLMNNTIRANILFGNVYDKVLYEKVLDICQLRADLRILPAEDLTEIGERGINMSGGQKQRISIARGVYSNADIFLMDDSLSA
jgi:ABC-type multidrug transport system fused ATPase/permease subunit